MFGLGVPELILILVIALLLFGARRLPDIAKGIGKSINAFKKGLKETEDNLSEDGEEKKKTKKTN